MMRISSIKNSVRLSGHGKEARLRSPLGFTLIELLVVITIVGLIMMTAFYTLGRSSQQVKLQMTVEQVASNLRFEQTRVKSGVVPEVESNSICRGYTFLNGKGFYTPVSEVYGDESCVGSLAPEQSLFFASGVEVESIVPEDMSPINELTILFAPPSGTVLFFDGSGQPIDAPSVDLTFSYTLSDYPVDGILTVNRSGLLNYKYE